MESQQATDADWAALQWMVEMGVDEAILDTPQDRYVVAPASEPQPAAAVAAPTSATPQPPKADLVTQAKNLAKAAADLPGLRAAIEAFDCPMRLGARQLVFADGQPQARVMVIGEAPGREEDAAGRPFVGPAGQFLDRMFHAIGLSRDADQGQNALYITNVIPWRMPQNRDPNADDLALFLPFLSRHVELVQPDVVVLMGNAACQAALGQAGITRLRGQWKTAFDRPCLPMLHPAYLLRKAPAKAEAWADLLALKSHLSDTP
jgi:DNA polymerase